MNKAERAMEAFKTKYQPSVVRAAKAEDPNVEVARMDGMIFYRFDDQSVLATKGRARSHQIWIVGQAT